jgi:eukaryotic-like serine/threonine-protein kinase
MGRVYRAFDRRLGRPVAIKVLGRDQGTNADATARLKREAEAASSLNHPGIVTIFDIGETPQSGLFIAMELIDGLNLRQWLRSDPSRADKLDLLRQAAKGLSAAHARGIVHRDVKPENIMVSRDGFAKVVDFGLAKSVEGHGENSQTDVMITAHGHVVGTIAYMSPEQLAGEPLDARSDIYSFGCVLRDAFGASAFANVIERCVQKDRALRYQTMDAVLRDLGEAPALRSHLAWSMAAAGAILAILAVVALMVRRPAPAVSPASASMAVLPFRPLGSEAYVADGISDALTTDLARNSGLTVVARNSARRYSSEADLQKAARDLGVRYILLGSVQPVADKLRINARLIDASNDAHVWAEHYDQPIGEIFSAENAIVRAVAAKVAPASAAGALAQPSDPRTADLYLRARFFAEDVSWVVQDRSIPLLEEVVRLDPRFLPARVALANQYRRKAFEPDPDRAWAAKAFVELQKIVAQDPGAAVAYDIRANLHWNKTYGFAHEEALADLDRAIQLDPNLVGAYNSRGAVLMHVGLLDDALRDFNRALRLDPFNAFAAYRIPRILWYQQKCAQAVAEYRKSSRFDDYFEYPIALQCAGRSEEALAAAEQLALGPDSNRDAASDIASAKAVLYALHGRRAQAVKEIRKAIASDKGSSHFHHAMYFIAAAYAQLRDPASALPWLERTAHEGMPCYPLFASDPLLDPIRSDPRIRTFLDVQHREWEQRRRGRGSPLVRQN